MQPSDDIERAKAWVQGCHDRANNWNFVIELLPTTSDSHNHPRVIGLVGAVRAPECGYMLNADYWGKGYATEAFRAFLPLFFEHFSGGEQGRFEYAEAFVDPALVSSQSVLKKAGFELVEVRKNDFENPTLGWRDTNVYRLYRPDRIDEDATNTPK
jgi:RimJ/RimL family protein N-acetyltransferase